MTAWIPGLTCKYNFNLSQTMLTISCSACEAAKHFPLRESHQLFEGLQDEKNP
jgi:RNase P subunit RPR2